MSWPQILATRSPWNCDLHPAPVIHRPGSGGGALGVQVLAMIARSRKTLTALTVRFPSAFSNGNFREIRPVLMPASLLEKEGVGVFVQQKGLTRTNYLLR
jgi:hypothetical protein